MKQTRFFLQEISTSKDQNTHKNQHQFYKFNQI